MARVLFSSYNLYKQLIPHIGAAQAELRIAGGRCSVWSDEATTALPCEGNFHGTAIVPVEKLITELKAIEDQPITLDLHQWGACRLFACRRSETTGDWENFNVPL